MESLGCAVKLRLASKRGDMARGVVIGVIATLVAMALCAYLGIIAGVMPANADASPSRLERWIAGRSLHATLAREAPRGANPVPLNDQNLIAGIRLYAENCAVCHGGADAKPTTIAHGLYQRPPQLAKDGVEDDPEGVTFWKVDHGIRLTGMPSFGKSLSDQQIWQLALFLKHMDALPPAAESAWRKVRASGAPPVPASALR
jgi:thiosulfate dehydrogenase